MCFEGRHEWGSGSCRLTNGHLEPGVIKQHFALAVESQDTHSKHVDDTENASQSAEYWLEGTSSCV